jgi:hypothetical protein
MQPISTSTQAMPAARATRWQPWTYRPRPSIYVDVTTGHGITSEGRLCTCRPQLALIDLITALPDAIEQVYLCGTLHGAAPQTPMGTSAHSPYNSWLLAAQPEKHFLDTGTSHDRSLVQVRRESDGRLVDVRTIAGWLGTMECTPGEVCAALARIGDHLRAQHAWADAALLAAPGRTGTALWRTSVGSRLSYPVLPAELRRLIHHTSGQGRYELFSAPVAGAVLPALYCLDAIWMYATPCLDELGIWQVVHDTLPHYAGYQPARYRVRCCVPDGWQHIGLLMVPTPDGAHWWYPAEPGMMGETWADGTELRIAFWPFPHACSWCAAGYHANAGASCPLHGWRIDILERLVFTKGRPLRTWAEKLIAVREACGSDELARAAVRNILLHATGTFHGTHLPITRTEPDLRNAPAGTPLFLSLSPEGETLYSWEKPGPGSSRFSDEDRPEWPAEIWARARSRLLLHGDRAGNFTGALTLPHEQLVALRLDALYTTADPHWTDAGKVGTFRRKWALESAAPWPRSETDLTALKYRAAREETHQ